MVYPDYFTDEMVRGAFAFIKHRHQFSDDQKTTIVKDEFEFGAPLGLLGLIAEKLFLTNYMERFLVARNEKIKQLAESDKWAQFVE